MSCFNAELTLYESAQVFHFRKIDGIYAAVVNGRILTEADEDAFARHYFDLDRDYQSLLKECAGNETVEKALKALPGMRVLNQPAWEALVAFILSANNNVSRIRSLVNELLTTYGKKYDYCGEALYGFPEPAVLANLSESELRSRVRCGYRAKYLIETAKMIADGFPLEELWATPYEIARKTLMQLPGVGGKVADCVLLFGLGHTCAFPVDVWVARLMEDWFHISVSREKMRDEARKLLGENCGLIQQSLFHAARTGLIEIQKKG